ncbi:unnamed protein product [Mycena citricolor]|uniref:Uncharacterized protein n=1 Tax=Mycena citricolor TaxID=2018698 RepID=A0AAD2H270_9AGAR|nr:unnamed protein product [Mycena citricolor]
MAASTIFMSPAIMSGFLTCGFPSMYVAISCQKSLFSPTSFGAYTPRIDSGEPSAFFISMIMARPGMTSCVLIPSASALSLFITNARPAAFTDLGFSVCRIFIFLPNSAFTFSSRVWFMCASLTMSTAIFSSLITCHTPNHLFSGWCIFMFPWPRMFSAAILRAAFRFLVLRVLVVLFCVSGPGYDLCVTLGAFSSMGFSLLFAISACLLSATCVARLSRGGVRLWDPRTLCASASTLMPPNRLSAAGVAPRGPSSVPWA